MKTREETIKQNEVIAKWMGLVRHEADSSYNKSRYYKQGKDKRMNGYFVAYFDGLKYHEKWQELMPVIDKIRELSDFIVDDFLGESGEPLPTIFFTIEEVHEFCFKFIEWHNLQLKP